MKSRHVHDLRIHRETHDDRDDENPNRDAEQKCRYTAGFSRRLASPTQRRSDEEQDRHGRRRIEESPTPPHAVDQDKGRRKRSQPLRMKPDRQPRDDPKDDAKADPSLNSLGAPQHLIEQAFVKQPIDRADAHDRKGDPRQHALHGFFRNTISRWVNTIGQRTFSNSTRPHSPAAFTTSARSSGRSSGNFQAPTSLGQPPRDAVEQRRRRERE